MSTRNTTAATSKSNPKPKAARVAMIDPEDGPLALWVMDRIDQVEKDIAAGKKFIPHSQIRAELLQRMRSSKVS